MKEHELRIGTDNICPVTHKLCDDECCPVGAICNLRGDEQLSEVKEHGNLSERSLAKACNDFIINVGIVKSITPKEYFSAGAEFGYKQAMKDVEHISGRDTTKVEFKFTKVDDNNLPSEGQVVIAIVGSGLSLPAQYKDGKFWRYIDANDDERVYETYYPVVIAFMPMPEYNHQI